MRQMLLLLEQAVECGDKLVYLGVPHAMHVHKPLDSVADEWHSCSAAEILLDYE
eukprot:CAMPEP_0114632334 /NCGR_PEP_ID=MMETSP0168-20121206/14881_1 /TAXON_ID=95228 ORGANISM="Vannella sp., Strain DIVA3 517/6/12" /NCGR_SAMPLE_ID=MMETSP0168 /ASSEMBLY_ACC=CAM_ASM_000044 /LENGTH=53 /DNA_ID=CAMNT_0001843941 /DNA_START=142 /DNA_END=303 /DNA_ORIENTATION=+